MGRKNYFMRYVDLWYVNIHTGSVAARHKDRVPRLTSGRERQVCYWCQTPWEKRHYLCYMSPIKRICVFEHSVMTNFNCACPAIQRDQGSGFLSESSSWFTARIGDKYQIRLTRSNYRMLGLLEQQVNWRNFCIMDGPIQEEHPWIVWDEMEKVWRNSNRWGSQSVFQWKRGQTWTRSGFPSALGYCEKCPRMSPNLKQTRDSTSESKPFQHYHHSGICTNI